MNGLTVEEVEKLLKALKAADHLAKCVRAHRNSNATRHAEIEYTKARAELGGEITSV